MLARRKNFFGHFKHSSSAYERLHNIKHQLKLPERKLMQDEPTRGDSKYYILDYMSEQHRAISFCDADFRIPDKFTSH